MDIGFQLFSARNYPLAEVLRSISRLGYRQAEGYSGLYADPKGLRAHLDENGLSMPTAHVALADLKRPEQTLRLAEALDIKVVICPWLAPHERPADGAGWSRFGARLQELARPYQEAGLGFAYHNHDFEFEAFDGRFGLDLLLEAAPAISVEADIAWIARGGADPIRWLSNNGSRILAVHLKDIAPEGENADEDGWADVGHGVLPWAELFTTITQKTGARYFVAEHDHPNDIDRFAARSIAAIRSFGA